MRHYTTTRGTYANGRPIPMEKAHTLCNRIVKVATLRGDLCGECEERADSWRRQYDPTHPDYRGGSA